MERSLADTYDDLIGGVAFDLGWGRSADNWDANKLETLKTIVKNGLREFYHPIPDQTGTSHQWSFLKPRVQITLASGESTVQLPSDFKGVEGEVLVVTTTGVIRPRLKVGGMTRAQRAAYPESTGVPAMLDIEPLKQTTPNRGQRFQFVVWPTADADYTLEFYYSILGEFLSGDKPYAYGGAEHASTILASCLAWAELHLDDIAQGPKYLHWRERLAASISMDRQKRPQTLGYNGDRSDELEAGYGAGQRRRNFGTVILQVNGSDPS